MAACWQAGRFRLDLSRTLLMGVLNCTPDSFSDGGQFLDPDKALAHADAMIADGADLIDVGAESTRPGSEAISADEEIARLTPVVKALVADGRVPISVDSKKTAVMRAVLDLGADIINDVHGFEDNGAFAALADSNCGLCIMHMRGMPATMQENTDYDDVVDDVAAYLAERVALAEQHGIARDRLVLDPGFGFGKTPAQNMRLVREIARIGGGLPTLLGVSRKSTIGHFLGGVAVDERLHGSVTLAALGAWCGAAIVRVHDVRATRDALCMVEALRGNVHDE